MLDPLVPLPITQFEVHAIYGAHFHTSKSDTLSAGAGIARRSKKTDREKWEDWFEDCRKSAAPSPVRASWTPIYRNHSSMITFELPSCRRPEAVTVIHPKLFERKHPEATAPLNPFGMKCCHTLTVRQDGSSAINVRLLAPMRQPENAYGLADVLAAMLLAPRTMNGLQLEPTDIAPEVEMASIRRKRSSQESLGRHGPQNSLAELGGTSISPLFRLFLSGVKSFLLTHRYARWAEYTTSGQDTTTTDEDKATSESNQSTVWPWVGDPQVPYFAVILRLPQALYNELFLETDSCRDCKRMARRKYTRHFAAILNRWLSPENAHFISTDYLDGRKLTQDGAFVNKYMNSLSFVSYSPTVTLCVRPEEPASRKELLQHPALDPQEATYGSILRCIELSRLRWHHAIRLNQRLDDLVGKVIKRSDPAHFETLLENLTELRAEAASHFLDPLTYLWDATVGSEIAQYLQVNVIEEIEQECISKLQMVGDLIRDKRDVLRIRDLRDSLKAKSRVR